MFKNLRQKRKDANPVERGESPESTQAVLPGRAVEAAEYEELGAKSAITVTPTSTKASVAKSIEPSLRPSNTAGRDSRNETLLSEGDRIWLRGESQFGRDYFAHASCMTLVDVNKDGLPKLMICGQANDNNENAFTLKIISATGMEAKATLHHLPRGMVSFLNNNDQYATVLAMPEALQVFRGAAPLLKHVLPVRNASAEEERLWNDAQSRCLTPDELWCRLRSLTQEIGASQMSTRGLHYISSYLCQDSETLDILTAMGSKLAIKDCITCITKCVKGNEEGDDCMIYFGSDMGYIYALETASFAAQWRVHVDGNVCQMEILGKFTDPKSFKVVISCRNKTIFFLKPEGAIVRNSTIHLDSPCVTFCCSRKSIIVALRSKAIQVYSSHGRVKSGTDVSSPITAMAKMEQLGTADAFAVAMLNCMINVYVLKQDGTLALAHAICMHPDFPITAMQFGTFDRQKRCLLGLTATGDLHVLTMRRGKAFEAKFDAKVVQDLPQTMRKVKPRGMTAHQLLKLMREDQETIFALYQEGRAVMHHRTVKSYYNLVAKTRTSEVDAASGATSSSSKPCANEFKTLKSSLIEVRGSILGVGPRFILEVCLTNLSRQEMTKILVTLLCNKKQYSTTPLFERVPILLPLQQETGTASKRLRFIVEAVGTAKTDLQEVKVCVYQETGAGTPARLLCAEDYTMPIADATGSAVLGTATGLKTADVTFRGQTAGLGRQRTAVLPPV